VHYAQYCTTLLYNTVLYVQYCTQLYNVFIYGVYLYDTVFVIISVKF